MGDKVVHAEHIANGDVGSEFVDCTGHCIGGSVRIGFRSDREAQAKRIPRLAGRRAKLIRGHVDGVHRARFAELVGFYVADDPDNFARRVGEEGQRQVLADRIFIGKEAVSERIADQNYAGAACRIGFFEVAAANDGHVHGAEIAGADEAHVNFGLIGHRQHRAALDRKRLVRAAAIERKGIDRAGFFYAGQSFYALQNIVEEIYFSAGSGESAMRDGDAHCEDVAGVEAGADIAKLPERANHQAGADQQDERQRDFADDEEIARFAAARRIRRACLA